MYKRTLRSHLLLLSIFCAAQVCCGQGTQTPLSKEQALKGVKVKAADGWKEVVSDKGRFRIMFPGEATVSESGAMQGFQLIGGDKHWFVYYIDYPNPSTDEAQTRKDYRQSIEALARKGGSQVKRLDDVTLNGRLGYEAVTEGRGMKSFMSGFLVGHRFYMMEVDVRDGADAGDETPPDVRQFFESFTFWV